eukprot:gnl/Dysnectes_brevis/2182_a2542_1431.p1 GENE.gnl/Dysnectes_brevis/2182_a2542_1431~~gnl/Dysnectes_brevis/2182_a2542_1431.p1  ORF type:complete len:181 (+),score=52.84 gnl/Dysnectes_brevis/2182_a2542_1431:395-937(+)
MGVLFSKVMRRFTKLDANIIMLGLDAAGKTTILYKLKVSEFVTTVPTVGFNVESLEYKNLSMQIWDVGGQDEIRPLWRHYFHNAEAVIFVVDSADRDEDRVGDARDEVQRLMSEEELRDCPFLILANKQDLPKAMTCSEISEKLGLNALRARSWHIEPSCARSGMGLYRGLDWLSTELTQ